MDQEKFDQHLMGYLFDELDEVTSAAMKRKIESDADCRELVLGLRATLEVAQLPVEEPSDDLEERILAAASLAQEGEPFHRKLLRSLSWAGSHAMRPQLAMAAMLVLVVGSSLLLLRVRTGAVAVTPTKENTGVAAGPEVNAPTPPATDDDLTPQPAPATSGDPTAPEALASAAPTNAPRAPASGAPLSDDQLAAIDEEFDEAMAFYSSGNYPAARAKFAKIKGTKSPKAGTAALYEARAVRAEAGCPAAIPYYKAARASGSADATWEQADCHRIMGEPALARELLLSLKGNKSYEAKAQKELENQGETANTGGDGSSQQMRNAPKPASEPDDPPEPQQQQQQQQQQKKK